MEFTRLIRSLCQKLSARLRLKTRHRRELENEIARLREENRALVNSILGLAGIPPMRVARSQMSASAPNAHGSIVGATLSPQRAPRVGDPGPGSPGRGKPRPYNGSLSSADANSQAAPLRRRSWQQLGRVREIEDARAARRERESDTETFPAPSNIVPRA
jgi:hypothetical protein